MFNGFFVIYQKLLQSEQDKNIAIHNYFNMLESISSYVKVDKKSHKVSVSSFLCGYCGQFALTLKEKYGYDIEILVDSDEYDDYLIHVFNTYCYNGVKYYIDSRGITNDKKLFLDIYSNWENFDKISIIDKNSDKFEEYLKYVKNIFELDNISQSMVSWILKSYDFYHLKKEGCA